MTVTLRQLMIVAARMNVRVRAERGEIRLAGSSGKTWFRFSTPTEAAGVLAAGDGWASRAMVQGIPVVTARGKR